jgi:hypothetical protein
LLLTKAVGVLVFMEFAYTPGERQTIRDARGVRGVCSAIIRGVAPGEMAEWLKAAVC